MARETRTKTPTEASPPGGPLSSAVAGLLAWLIPGAGHWFLGRRVRAVILFVIIQGLFWWGVAIGGVFTVDPREELWWSRAQLCTGAGGVVSYYRQSAKHQSLVEEAKATDGDLDHVTQSLKAAKNLVLVAPAAGPARVFTGVAGMLNLLCIIDVVLLAALGLRGEPVRGSPTVSEEAA
jgi:hypothetical protein